MKRRACWIRCSACGYQHIGIVAGEPIDGGACPKCDNLHCQELDRIGRRLRQAQRLADLLPFTAAYSGDPCTCGTAGIPEEHAQDCPVYRWFWEHYDAAHLVVFGS
jgi:hypothetical protein